MLVRFGLVALLLMSSVTAKANPAGSILNKILGDVTAAYNKKERPMVIFDVDGTLLDNRHRIFRILNEFSKEKQYITPEAAQQLATLTIPKIQYKLTDTLAAVGITNPVVVQNAAAFWGERFFSEPYLKYDQPTPGSVDFVRRLYSNGARIVYLTARDVPRQLLGTVKSLRDFGYPIGIQGTELIMKPTMQAQDAVFKQDVMYYLRHYGKVIAVFDNEPENANLFHRTFPEATVIHYQAPHKPNAPPLAQGIQKIVAFQ